MTELNLHLRSVGAILIVLAFSHVFFGRKLDWKDDVAKLSPLNRQIFHVHTFFICLILAMMGVLCAFFAQTLLPPTPPTLLAKLVLAGLTVFWATRLYFQWFVYDWKLWRGHRFNTGVHITFTVLWSYFTLIFMLALRQQFGRIS